MKIRPNYKELRKNPHYKRLVNRAYAECDFETFRALSEKSTQYWYGEGWKCTEGMVTYCAETIHTIWMPFFKTKEESQRWTWQKAKEIHSKELEKLIN